jgi:hypothetical protein
MKNGLDMGEIRKPYKILFGKPEEETILET